MNIIEKILASHANCNHIAPGDFLECDIDSVMVHEQLGGRISPEFRKLGLEKVWDPNKILYVLDHWVPPPDVRAAKMHQRANQFAKDFSISTRLGQNEGICHQVLPEQGLALPGKLIVGSDSHSTTYGAFNCFGTGIGATDVAMIFATGKLWFKVPETIHINLEGTLGSKTMGKDVILQMMREFGTDGANYQSLEISGSGLKHLSIDARMSIANMSVEMGAKACIFEGDPLLTEWFHSNVNINKNSQKIPSFIIPDKNAQYSMNKTYDLSEIPPLVAKPYRPDNVVPVAELGRIPIDEAFLGSCTNGRMEDLRVAAQIIKGQKVAPGVKFIIIPASRSIYLQALKEGLIEILVTAGGVVEYPSCGPCIGGHLGVLGPGEVCISSSNRNFKGRMGDPTSQSYLASPAVVAASAIAGFISEPENAIWKHKTGGNTK
jgi:3-isopropylmalate/(R)-2-methylmalate dehydratase large subunit